MQRSRKRRSAKTAHPAVRTDKRQAAFADEARIDADRPAEMLKVRPAAEIDVLAIVDRLAGGLIDERTGSPTPAGPGFKERYGKASFGQRRGRCQSGQAAPDDDHPPVHEAPEEK